MTRQLPKVVHDTDGASTPEYAIVLVLILTVVVSIGTVASSTLRDTFNLASLRSSETSAVKESQSSSARADGNGGNASRVPPWIIVFAASQALLALVFVALFLRTRGRKTRLENLIRTDRIVDDQLKSALLILRSKGATGLPWEAQVGQFMSEQFETASLKTSFSEVKAKLESSLHQAVFVVDNSGEFVGIVTMADLEPGCTARKMMREATVQFDKSTLLASALRQMVQDGITIAPVTQNNQVCGTLSYMEAMLGLTAALQVIQENEAKFQEKMMNLLGPNPTCGVGSQS